MAFHGRFPECEECRFFRPSRMNPICKQCPNGEFFEERTRHREMQPDDLLHFPKGYRDDE